MFVRAYRLASSQTPQHFDFALAVYVIARNIPKLPTKSWLLCCDDKCDDKEVLAAFSEMRYQYMAIYEAHPDGLKGWANHTLEKLRKLMGSRATRNVAMLFLLHLLGK